MPDVRVTIPKNIKHQAPFAVAVFTSEPLLLELELLVDGVRRPFGLEVGGEATPSGPKQELGVDGAVDVTILDWGTAKIGAKVKLVALTQQDSNLGTVIV